MNRRVSALVICGVFGVLLSGCCSPSDPSRRYVNGCKPPLNCLGSAYDGSSAPCYRPPGPFWCAYPGPCSKCRDPYLHCYEETDANWIGRHVCDPNAPQDDGDCFDEDFVTATQPAAAPRVIHQAKAEE